MTEQMFRDEPPKSTGMGFMTAFVGIGTIAVMGVIFYFSCVFEVPSESMAVLIRKTGMDLKNSDELAPSSEYKGIQRGVLGPGRYTYNPFFWDWEIHKMREIPSGKIGIRISLVGDDLPPGEFMARLGSDGEILTKGVVPGFLNPGRYAFSPYEFDVIETEQTNIPAGFVGVVTKLTGPMPKKANQLLSEKGERGVQKETLKPGLHFLNPFENRVNLIDTRNQRFNLSQDEELGFGSKDGFWVSLDGVVDFKVNEEKAAEVYVIYNEDRNGPEVDDELIKKVILPHARSFCRLEGSSRLGREFIDGDTKLDFQHKFQTAMREACLPLGIDVAEVLITSTDPPSQIAKPVRERGIAMQEQSQYQQEILQQKSEQSLAIQKELVKQGQALVEAEKEVVQLTTLAQREQDVEKTKAEEKLAVAKLKLEAAKDEAEAIQTRGDGEAKIEQQKNVAEAAGWKNAVKAFNGDGAEYAKFVLYQKLAKAYRTIMVNTADSPLMTIFDSFTPGKPPQPGTAPSAGGITAGETDPQAPKSNGE